MVPSNIHADNEMRQQRRRRNVLLIKTTLKEIVKRCITYLV